MDAIRILLFPNMGFLSNPVSFNQYITSSLFSVPLLSLSVSWTSSCLRTIMSLTTSTKIASLGKINSSKLSGEEAVLEVMLVMLSASIQASILELLITISSIDKKWSDCAPKSMIVMLFFQAIKCATLENADQ